MRTVVYERAYPDLASRCDEAAAALSAGGKVSGEAGAVLASMPGSTAGKLFDDAISAVDTTVVALAGELNRIADAATATDAGFRATDESGPRQCGH